MLLPFTTNTFTVNGIITLVHIFDAVLLPAQYRAITSLSISIDVQINCGPRFGARVWKGEHCVVAEFTGLRVLTVHVALHTDDRGRLPPQKEARRAFDDVVKCFERRELKAVAVRVSCRGTASPLLLIEYQRRTCGTEEALLRPWTPSRHRQMPPHASL